MEGRGGEGRGGKGRGGVSEMVQVLSTEQNLVIVYVGINFVHKNINHRM